MSANILRITDFSSPPASVNKKSVLSDEVLGRRLRSVGTPLNENATTEKIAFDSQVLDLSGDPLFPGQLGAGSGKTVAADAFQVKGNSAIEGGNTDAQIALTNDADTSYSFYCGGSAATAPFVAGGFTLFNHTCGNALLQTGSATGASQGNVLSIGTFSNYGLTTKTGAVAAQCGQGISGDGSPGTSEGLFEVFHPDMTDGAMVIAQPLGIIDGTEASSPWSYIADYVVDGPPNTRKANIWVFDPATGIPVHLAPLKYIILRL